MSKIYILLFSLEINVAMFNYGRAVKESDTINVVN